MAKVLLEVNSFHKEEMECHGKFVQNLGLIQHIYIISRIEICYTCCILLTLTVAPTLPGFLGLNRCIKYIANHPKILYLPF